MLLFLFSVVSCIKIPYQISRGFFLLIIYRVLARYGLAGG